MYINELEKYCQERGWPPPRYQWTYTSPTLPVLFGCQVEIGGFSCAGEHDYYDIKEAQEFAAKKAYEKLNWGPCDHTPPEKSTVHSLQSDGNCAADVCVSGASSLPTQQSTVPAVKVPPMPPRPAVRPQTSTTNAPQFVGQLSKFLRKNKTTQTTSIDYTDKELKHLTDYSVSTVTKRFFGNREEYVEGKWDNHKLKELSSFQLIHPNDKNMVYGRKQNQGILLTFDEYDFIARIRFDKLEQLDFNQSFELTKLTFFERILFTEIIKDDLSADRNNAIDELKQLLKNRNGKSVDNIDYAEDLYQLSLILDNEEQSSNECLLKEIIDNNSISYELKSVCKRLVNKESYLDARSKVIPKLKCTVNLYEELKIICKDGMNSHRKGLRDEYLLMPSKGLKDYLDSGCESPRYMDDKSVLLVSKNDIKLFSDLLEMMSERPFLDLLYESWDSLFVKVQKIRSALTETSHGSKTIAIRNYMPLTNPVYFYLCKSFMEVIQEIITKANASASDLLIKKRSFILAAKINWHSPSPLNEVLERQYYFIFLLMESFKPSCLFKKRKEEFYYELEVLQQFVDNTSWWHTETSSVDGDKEDRWVWVYILDDTLSGFLSEENVHFFQPLLKGYTDFVTKTKGDHFESLRVFTHQTARFIQLTRPYVPQGTDSENDENILRKQLDYFKKATSEGKLNNLRVLVDVYNEYWKHKERVITKIPMKFPHEPLISDLKEISTCLIIIVDKMLSTDAETEVLIKCFRSFNDFLEDLDGINFDWFIKGKDNTHYLKDAEPINESKGSYKISHPEEFIKKWGTDVPRHYLIEVIKTLSGLIYYLICEKKLPKDSDDEKLKMTSKLLLAVRKSFQYLREQPDYISFDRFEEDSTLPFMSAVENSSSYDDFKNRICIVGESFTFLRRQDEIDVKKALDLYKQMNIRSTCKRETLEVCYDVYQNRFNLYVEQTVNKSLHDKIMFIIKDIQNTAKPVLIGKWTENFQTKTLPKLLAGLAAVWSLQQSTDIASTGKSLKPHCIQILCILRLLNVDKGSLDNHLAQVLTGQGKSVILGLLSCLLALMGHKVRLVCYSEYLARRDEQDFKEFFQIFGISKRIKYGTFEEMAYEVFHPIVNGKKQSFRELVSDRILNQSKAQNGVIKYTDVSNAILLIDDVDVFFTEKFYGNTYMSGCSVELPGLCSIQEKLWEIIKDGENDKSTISGMINDFIRSEVDKRNQDLELFNNFLLKPGKYKLLKYDGVTISEKEYTNQSLFDEHIDLMIDYGMAVADGTESDWFFNEYKINEDGVIASRGDDEVYYKKSYVGYFNTFNYFRLKKKDFDHKSYQNYGYFKIDCGSVSYARLPEKYALILGVSGTLTDLNEEEKKVLNDSYSIKQISSMPSFFGHSKVTFDMQNEFKCLDSKERWLCEIDTQTNRKINMGRSVLIFFDTSTKINEFKNRFFSKYDRFFVLTEDTEYWLKKKYIDEAGVTKTVTLASRGMGRGVDFKSSLTVEKNGGVHVIQTFFSLDMKEETQIKGRTARKDNEGSYQLILCTEHLIKDKLLESSECDVNYTNLNDRRNVKYREITLQNNERVKQAQCKHQVTMDYLESFFKKQ